MLTAKSQYYRVYVGDILTSNHTTERECVEAAIQQALDNPTKKVAYRHEYSVEVDVSRLRRNIDDVPPSVPLNNAVAIISTTQLDQSWSAASDLNGIKEYDIRRNGVVVATVPAAQTSYSHTGLSQIAYTIDVRARDNAGNVSAYSTAVVRTPADITAPTAPTLGTPTATSSVAIQIPLANPSTDAGGSGLASYSLQRATDAAFTQGVGTTTGISTGGFPIIISGLASSTTYYFRARGVDGAGNQGAFGNTVSATTQAASNQPPSWAAVPDIVANDGQAVNVNIGQYATDPEGGPLTFSIDPTSPTNSTQLSAAGLTLSSGGVLSGTKTGNAVLPLIIRATEDSDLANWNAIIAQPGVVFSHNMENQAEVDNFRFRLGPGNVPNERTEVFHLPGEGAGPNGGAIRFVVPAGGRCQADWRRPFSPLNAGGNGKPTNDQAANGTLTRRTYDPNSADNTKNWNWQQGWYGHADYQGTAQFDGSGPSKFYIRQDVRLSSSRFLSGQPDGKLIYIDAAPGNNQEIVVQSTQDPRFRMYTRFGAWAVTTPQDPNFANGKKVQPGGVYDLTCIYPSFNSCFLLPANVWVTLMFGITPGRHWDFSGDINAAEANPAIANTRIECYVALPGDSDYTKVFDKANELINFEAPFGWNMVKFSAYMNNVNARVDAGWTQDFRKLVMSRDFIPLKVL